LADALVAEVGAPPSIRVISLVAAGPDRALRSVLSGSRARAPRAAAASEVIAALGDPAIRFVVVDGVQLVQDGPVERGRIEDMRVRHLLIAAAEGRIGAPVLVISRASPSADLGPTGVTTIALPSPAGFAGRPLPPGNDQPSLLEVLASAERASSGWFLAAALGRPLRDGSFATPEDIEEQLRSARVEGLVHLVASLDSGDWYQIADGVSLAADSSDRAYAVHRAVAATLQRADVQRVALAANDPDLAPSLHERTVAHLMLAGDVEAAAECYWVSLGNYSELGRDCRYELGARVCRALNGGENPDVVSDLLRSTGRATNVLNDWGLHALASGDRRTATSAAALAKDAEAGIPAWARARLHRHHEEALRDAGYLQAGMDAADRALVEARNQTRQFSGIGTQEGIDAMNDAYHAIIHVLVRQADAEGIAAALDELTRIHKHARDLLVQFNENSIVPVPVPSRPSGPDDLFAGWASAWLAWFRGDTADALRLADRVSGSSSGDSWTPDESSMALLQLEAAAAEGDSAAALALADEIRTRLERSGDPGALCDFTLIALRIDAEHVPGVERLQVIDQCLSTAAACGLGLQWIDALVERSRVQLSLGDVQGAQASARAALFGPTAELAISSRWPAAVDLPGALDPLSTYAVGARRAIDAALAADLDVGDDLRQRASNMSLRWQSPPLPKPRRSASTRSGTERRRELHEAARRVIEQHETYGAPFALYLRKYDFEILHGPLEWDARLLENALYADLPARVEMISIQSLGTVGYTTGRTAFDRDPPSLVVETDTWKDVVAALIAQAELIVSEVPMIGEGARFELETAFRLRRWDRTVLVLPPLHSPFEVVDSDPVVQLFPRCVWADDFHDSNFVDSPVVADLVERLARIAALTEVRRTGDTATPGDAEFPPVELHRIIPALEARGEIMGLYLSGALTAPNDYDEYYDFWSVFRAASLRTVDLANGDRSLDNRSRLIRDYLRMGQAMLRLDPEGQTVTVTGDPNFAEQCAQSAYALIEDDDPYWVRSLRPDAEKLFASALQIQAAIEQRPDVVKTQPRYGPFTVRRSPP
jgi:hypothetical protein